MPTAKLKTKLHSLFYENRDDCNFILQNDENQALNVKLRTKFSSKDIEMDFKLQKETTICVRKIYRQLKYLKDKLDLRNILVFTRSRLTTMFFINFNEKQGRKINRYNSRQGYGIKRT